MIGKTISHYKIIEKIGSGGMGVVYKAHDTKLDRDVALKFLSQNLTTDKESIKRFQIEAKSAAALNHPNIVTIYEIGEHEGQLFIAMEYIEGKTLREEINEQLISNDDIESIVEQVCEGLGKAHEKGIIHRDIKPENILIDEYGLVKILDFGLAKLKGAGNLTRDMSTLGTAKYLSPEQARGEKVDNRSDIWSVGVVLYEMLTGRVPFKGDYEASVIYSILNDEPTPIPFNKELAGIDKIISMVLAKNPEERYSSISGLQSDLKKIQNGTAAEGESSEIKSHHEKSTFLKTIFQRHIPQFLGLYLIACWIVFQFVDWLVNRYVLSTHLPDFCLAVLLSLLPSVLIMVYIHGRPGPGRWTKVEKISIPINLILSASLLIVLFADKDLGAIQKTVTLVDEEGNRFERIIPKSEFRKRLAVFPFENTTGDSAYDWLQNGICNLIVYDLSQDMIVLPTRGYNSTNMNKINSVGYPHGIGMPVTFSRKIASELKRDFFVTSSFDFNEKSFTINTKLYETNTGKLISESLYKGDNIFNLVDQITIKIRQDLAISPAYIDRTEDLPVSEITSGSYRAFRLYTLASNQRKFTQNWQKALELYKLSVKEDSTFTYALVYLTYAYDQLGDDSLAIKTIEKALQYVFKVPERNQFDIKAYYYAITNKLEKKFAILKLKVDFFPEDISAHNSLAGQYYSRGDYNHAISEYKKFAETPLQGWFFLWEYPEISIGRCYQKLGELDEAEESLQSFLGVQPYHPKALYEMALVCMDIGDEEKALEHLHRALFVWQEADPDYEPAKLARDKLAEWTKEEID